MQYQAIALRLFVVDSSLLSLNFAYNMPTNSQKSKKTFKPIDLKAFYYLVAGAGFEPTTFGL